MIAKIFWRNTGWHLIDLKVEDSDDAVRHMEAHYGPMWHVQYRLFCEVLPKRRPARRAHDKRSS